MTPIEISENTPLKLLNTFKTGGNACYFVDVSTIKQLIQAVSFAQKRSLPIFILGEGSNILISDEGFDGLVIRMKISGITFQNETEEKIEVRVGAGEHWDFFVEHMVSKGLYGIENLSGIPGSVGAAPVQNIGAYGVEAKDSILFVDVFDIEDTKIKKISSPDCNFSYRDSIFKTEKGKKYIIVSVTFLLKKHKNLSTDYRDLALYLKERDITHPSLQDIRNAILEIRKQKLPSLADYGTAGSFFKNIIIQDREFKLLKERFPKIPSFLAEVGKVKIPTAWVFDNICNLKGLREGNVGVYERQALVLVTFGNATSLEVKNLSDFIIEEVKKKTGLLLEREVQLVGMFD
ncbi:MAG: UDP-N-acetylmuramate dehydrogenase [Patescibacteria group bacterium]